ncbi:transposase [Variovorax paradoxus]|nr:transposase [Variovorax paradoxus]
MELRSGLCDPPAMEQAEEFQRPLGHRALVRIREFDELARGNASPVATQAIERIAKLYKIEAEAREMAHDEQLTHRKAWEALHVWMSLERMRVPDGGAMAGALDYGLKRWKALGRFLEDGAVSGPCARNCGTSTRSRPHHPVPGLREEHLRDCCSFSRTAARCPLLRRYPAGLQLVQEVGPLLHHRLALDQEGRTVVAAAQLLVGHVRQMAPDGAR